MRSKLSRPRPGRPPGRDASRAHPRRQAGPRARRRGPRPPDSIPNGRKRPPSSSGSRRPERASARRSPARRRSVSFTTRSRMSSRPTTIEAWRARSRSNSPSSPRSESTTSHPAGGAPRRPGTGTTRPRSGQRLGLERGRPRSARSKPARDLLGDARPRPRPGGEPFDGWRATWRSAASKTSADPPTAPAIELVISSMPPPSMTRRSSCSWTFDPLARASYCSLTRRAAAASVIAMNGISYGTSNRGMSCFFAASRSASGTSCVVEPDPEARARRPRAWRSARRRPSAWPPSIEVVPRRQDDLATREPRGGVLVLGDRDPAHAAIAVRRARGKFQAAVGEQGRDRQHRAPLRPPRPLGPPPPSGRRAGCR